MSAPVAALVDALRRRIDEALASLLAPGTPGAGGQEKITVVKTSGAGGVLCCRATVPVPVGSVSQGINCSGTGKGYVMYTVQKAPVRFGTLAGNDHFVCVRGGRVEALWPISARGAVW